MLHRPDLIATMLAMILGASSAEALLVSARPAWDGLMRAGMPTEVAIRVVSDRGGTLTLMLTDRSISYRHGTELEPNVEYLWRVALASPSGERLQLRVQLDDEPISEQTITLRRHLGTSPLVAVVADQPMPLDDVQATTVHVASDSLPFHGSSYAAVDLIVIHRESLMGIAPQQLIALQHHATQCGRIVIVGVIPAVVAAFADHVGCGGRFLVAAESTADLGAHVDSLLETVIPQLPSASSLHSLLDDNGMGRQIPPLVAFFTIYFCILLMAARSQRALVYLVSASTAAILIGLVAWTVNPGHTERVTWAEMQSHAGAARFASIVRVLGGGGDQATIDIPVDASPPRALQPTNLVVVSNPNGDGAGSMSFDTRLFSQHEFVASGVIAAAAPLIVEHADAVPRITNPGAAKSPAALLAWRDAKYSVPPLVPKAKWRPTSQPEPWGTSRVEQLFRQRAMRASVALLFEYAFVSQEPADADTTRVFLMVRP